MYYKGSLDLNYTQMALRESIGNHKEDFFKNQMKIASGVRITIGAVDYIAYQAFTDAYDMLQESKSYKFLIKKYADIANKEFDKVNKHIKEKVEMTGGDNWGFWVDSQNQIYNKVEDALCEIREAVKVILEERGVKNVDLISQCYLAYLMLDLADCLYVQFFRDEKALTGLDYSETFIQWRVHGVFRNWVKSMEEFKIDLDIRPYHDERFKVAYGNLMKCIMEDNFFNDAFTKGAEMSKENNPERYKKLKENLNAK